MNISSKEAQESEHKEIYSEIIKFYDIAESMIDSIESDGIENPEEQVLVAAPVIEQLQKSTDILSETYIKFVKANGVVGNSDKRKVESAIREIFVSISKFADDAEKILVK